MARHEAIAQAAAQRVVADRTYRFEIKVFGDWVESQINSAGLPPLEPNGHIVTKPNVELYFSEVVEKKTRKPEAARRVLYAPDYYARNFEGKPHNWTCLTDAVTLSLDIQKQGYCNANMTKMIDVSVNTSVDVLRPARMRQFLEMLSAHTGN